MCSGPSPFRLLMAVLFFGQCVKGFPYSNWNVPDRSSDRYQLAMLGPRTPRYQEFAQYMVMAAQSSRVVGFVREDMLHPACGSLPAQAIAVLRESHGVLIWIDSVDIPADVDGILAYAESLCACVGISNHSLLMYAFIILQFMARVMTDIWKLFSLTCRMHPEPCPKQVSPCFTVQMSMRVAGRLMQLERLEHASSKLHYQGNQASLPSDLADIIRHYQQVRCCVSIL